MQTAIQQNSFAEDVRGGLSADPKFLSSKYFYDDEGSRLFQDIMRLPEYYLTRAETEIFQTQTKRIYEAFAADSDAAFDLIELGAGDGTKTFLLVDYFLEQKAAFSYVPIDISAEALHLLTEKFRARFPDLSIQTEQGDYFHSLETFKSKSERRKVIMFLGSNIGNFGMRQAQDFFANLRRVMNTGDLLFIGFDLKKDPRTILRAYDDANGTTAEFNLNLLKRMNRELGADFDAENFSHYASYHPIEGAARSFLISRKAQKVFFEALNQTFEFAAWEPIFMEISQKYDLEMIEELARTSGFAVAENFFDSRTFYTNSLWKSV